MRISRSVERAAILSIARWTAIMLVACLSGCGPDARMQLCDELAAGDRDVTRPPGVAGVPMTKLDGPRAVEACQAVAQTSTDPRIFYQYARALDAVKRHAEAVDWHRKAAERGHVLAQFNLGFMYSQGHGVTKNDAQALEWYHKAAEAGFADAQYELGVMHANGEGVVENDAEAVALYRKAAMQGFASAQLNLGAMYANGEGVEQDYSQAIEWYLKAAEQGLPEPQFYLGFMYSNGQGVAKDDAKALEWYRKAADQGNADAQVNLGSMYANGQGVTTDYTEAAVWYRKAADQEIPMAQFNLGVMYANGRGLSKDDTQALAWFRKSAEHGLAQAQLFLGNMYSTGQGVATDQKQAVSWFQKAADQGLARAQMNLGGMYANGRGMAVDDAQAVIWYRKAAEQSDVGAQIVLGVMYAEGRGVPKDEATALQWYRKAAEQGGAEVQLAIGTMYSNGQGVTKDDFEAVKWFRKAADQGDINAIRLIASAYETGTGVDADSAVASVWHQRAADLSDSQNEAVAKAQFPPPPPEREFQSAVGDWVCVDDSTVDAAATITLRVRPNAVELTTIDDRELTSEYVSLVEYTNIRLDTDKSMASRKIVGTTHPRFRRSESDWEKEVAIKVEGENLSFKDVGAFSALCVRADVGPMLEELTRSVEMAEKESKLLIEMSRKSWFSSMALISPDRRCDRYRKTFMSLRNVPAIAVGRLVDAQLTLAEIEKCVAAPSEDGIMAAFSQLGMVVTTPSRWRVRLDTLFKQGRDGSLANVQPTPNAFRNDQGDESPISIIEDQNTVKLSIPPPPNRTTQSRAPAQSSELYDSSATANDQSDSSVASDCLADAARPTAPEDFVLVANGRRYLTGQSVRMGVTGEFYVVEAALGFDGSCRPDPYQIYVFFEGKQVGTLAQNAMSARSSGAILKFSAKDQESIEFQFAMYAPNDAACCPSKVEKKTVSIRSFMAPQESFR